MLSTNSARTEHMTACYSVRARGVIWQKSSMFFGPSYHTLEQRNDGEPVSQVDLGINPGLLGS